MGADVGSSAGRQLTASPVSGLDQPVGEAIEDPSAILAMAEPATCLDPPLGADADLQGCCKPTAIPVSRLSQPAGETVLRVYRL